MYFLIKFQKRISTFCFYIQETESSFTLRALSIQGKKPEISVGAKVEFPIGKKLFHLVVNPGTSRCPTDFLAVDLELVQTKRNV